MECCEEAEEARVYMDLLAVGVVCQQKYEETKSCRSAAHFLSGMAIDAGKGDKMESVFEGELGHHHHINIISSSYYYHIFIIIIIFVLDVHRDNCCLIVHQ